jgi:hypothetical protein
MGVMQCVGLLMDKYSRMSIWFAVAAMCVYIVGRMWRSAIEVPNQNEKRCRQLMVMDGVRMMEQSAECL